MRQTEKKELRLLIGGKSSKKVSNLPRKVALQRQDWQHKVTSDIASRYDIGVTEKLNTKGMTKTANPGSKRKSAPPALRPPQRKDGVRKQKSGLNKSILSVGFGALNSQIAYKIEAKGGSLLSLNTRKVKPSIKLFKAPLPPPRCRQAFILEWGQRNAHQDRG